MMPCRLKRAQQPVLCFVCCQTPGRFLLANWTRILWDTAQNAVSSSNNGDSVPAAIATVYLSLPQYTYKEWREVWIGRAVMSTADSRSDISLQENSHTDSLVDGPSSIRLVAEET